MPPYKLAPKWVYLSHKVMVETSEPILGLQYVDEFLKETKPAECEPRYTCNLCAVTGKTLHIFWRRKKKNLLRIFFFKNANVLNFSKNLAC